MTEELIKIEHVVVPLNTVLEWYARHFKTGWTGNNIVSWEAFTDTSKEMVVFQLVVKHPPKQ